MKLERKKWVIADLHLGQTDCFTWRNQRGRLTRPFIDHDDYWEYVKEEWNSLVAPQDKVYILGDLAIKKSALSLIKELSGHKTLIAGNHDIFSTKLYLESGIGEVRGVRVFTHGSLYDESPPIILSHIPLAEECLKDKWKLNIHGHLHDNTMHSPQYACVSVERTGFIPKDLVELVKSW
jgi:calcineurin-like phosphoesterase family protein